MEQTSPGDGGVTRSAGSDGPPRHGEEELGRAQAPLAAFSSNVRKAREKKELTQKRWLKEADLDHQH